MSTNFDPSALAVHNGQYLGLEVDVNSADIVILPVPWDVTTSYRAGTVGGPDAVIEASYQLDLYSPYLPEVWKMKVATLPIPEDLHHQSIELRKKSALYIEFLEQGGDVSESKEQSHLLSEINEGCLQMCHWVGEQVRQILQRGQKVVILGGDHSVPLGSIQAYSEKYPELSILHFDAHADLREAYEDFQNSHASIMFNVMESTDVKKLVQVGLRDVSVDEIEMIKADDRIHAFFDWEIQSQLQEGKPWKAVCKEIVAHLTPHVYVSFDIDGLDPKLCPSTGTPVPGGLEFSQAVTLIQTVIESGRKIVGADLVEVTPSSREGDDWDGNVGARMLFQLIVGILQSRKD